MTALAAIRSSAAAAEELSRDRLTDDLRPLRDALGPRKPRMSMTERAAWARLRTVRRHIVETVRMLHQAYYASVWDVLEGDLDDLHDERADAMRDIRNARHAHKRMERFG